MSKPVNHPKHYGGDTMKTELTYVDVLDHGFVRLVDRMGSDLSVARAARVSHDADWRVGQDTGSDERLIHYLWKHRHSTPFEAVTFTFEVKAPIFVVRQWHRHRTWSYNEVSARYTELPEEFYVPDPAKIGTQSKTNKQARDIRDDVQDILERAQISDKIRTACAKSFEAYHLLLQLDTPREIARSVLPMSTYTRMFATVNLLNLFKFLSLRVDLHAQYEIRCYALAILDIIKAAVPVCVSAWEEGTE